jgi:hypothetical protein
MDKKHIPSAWVKEPTAILVIHGIGNQNPVETIDQFARTLVQELTQTLACTLRLSHRLVKKSNSNGTDVWFDNYLRIERIENEQPVGPPIDVYEYYWAHYTEDQADMLDISKWVSEVSRGARKFYRLNSELGQKYDDESAFFKNRKFNPVKYSLLIYFFGVVLPALSYGIEFILKMLAYIPVIGIPFRAFARAFADSAMRKFANVIGDITIYNTIDQKCKFYRIRQEILNGAVKAIRCLVEKDGQADTHYGKVLIAGHSLGTQVAYDALNRIIHLVNADELKGYEGNNRNRISEILCGFVTFGSPLDKIAFFLRENVPVSQYIRMQMLHNFHAFKQRDWLPAKDKPWPHTIRPVFARLLEELPWLNFYDRRDYVSGSLDYYHKLENIDIRFTGRKVFTHSLYWSSPEMFKRIIDTFLLQTPASRASLAGQAAASQPIIMMAS